MLKVLDKGNKQMSYYGLRKVKVYKNEETGLYNISCEYYDSSCRDMRGNRIWDTCSRLLKEDVTKEDAEYHLFENTLDGNYHGTGGKYTCIEWGKNTVTLPKEQQDELNRLENLKWNSAERDEIEKIRKEKYANLSYEEWKKVTETDMHLKALIETNKSYSRVYNELRYKWWYSAWKKYLQDKKQAGNMIIKFRYSTQDYYITKINRRSIDYTRYREDAKVFKDTKEVLRNKLSNFNSIEDIRFICADIKSTEVLV